MLRCKIHRATVTEANIDYEGSITLDPILMETAGIAEFEQVHVLDINNGSRLTTYAIGGERGSGVVCLNGAAARLVDPGDLVIILAYDQVPESEVPDYKPTLVYVDSANRVQRVGHEIPVGVH
ncbi:MAG TPA: aspartate 1-decarboxylase [Dehalococcoidia bacterium]|jgi:aspartate 1-decarboxylase|nr:aspartate 1-decarboxylase [Dehalococcoidia bacterium]